VSLGCARIPMMARSTIAPLQRPNTLMQLSRSSILEAILYRAAGPYILAHPSRGNCREGRPVTARKRTRALSRSLAARARARIAELDQARPLPSRASAVARHGSCWVISPGVEMVGADPARVLLCPSAHTGKSCSLIPELPAGRAEALLAAAPMPSASIALRPSNSRSTSIHIAPSRPISRA
jgi:hypothetical protein